MSFKEKILKNYKFIKEQWQSVKLNEDFYYDIAIGGSFFSKKYNLRRRNRDSFFWEKIDEVIDDITQPGFPYELINKTNNYKIFASDETESLLKEINDRKTQLTKDIIIFNTGKTKSKMITKDNIVSMMQEYMALPVSDQPKEESSPLIVIDGITFQLIKRARLDKRYSLVVQIRSTDKDKKERKFWTYRSNSELGIWRLCIEETINGSLYKGIVDYVQSSLLHLSLQRLLNEYAAELPYQEVHSQRGKRLDLCFCAMASMANCGMDEAKREIDSVDRVISHETPFHNLFELKTKGYMDCGGISSHTDDTDVDKVLSGFSEEFEQEFEVDNTKLTLLFTYDFDFENVINGTASVYSITLRRKQPNADLKTNEVNLCFTKAKLIEDPNSDFRGNRSMQRNLTRICNQDFHIFPFLLTTPSAQITPFGLYSEYIPCGVFICKLFDYYDTQCTITERKEHRCTQLYAYIGRRYAEVFPIKNIIQDFKETCIVEDFGITGQKDREVEAEEQINSKKEENQFATVPDRQNAKKYLWNGPLISRFRQWKETRRANKQQQGGRSKHKMRKTKKKGFYQKITKNKKTKTKAK